MHSATVLHYTNFQRQQLGYQQGILPFSLATTFANIIAFLKNTRRYGIGMILKFREFHFSTIVS